MTQLEAEETLEDLLKRTLPIRLDGETEGAIIAAAKYIGLTEYTLIKCGSTFRATGVLILPQTPIVEPAESFLKGSDKVLVRDGESHII